MNIRAFRKRLVERLANEAEVQAGENGRSSARDFGEYRYHAGVAKGLLMAAITTNSFLKDDEDDIDG